MSLLLYDVFGIQLAQPRCRRRDSNKQYVKTKHNTLEVCTGRTARGPHRAQRHMGQAGRSGIIPKFAYRTRNYEKVTYAISV